MEVKDPAPQPLPLSGLVKPATERPDPVTRFAARRGLSDKQRRTLRNIRHLHRIFQVTLGLLMSQHPKVQEACGGTVRWTYSNRFGGGYTFEGPRATFVVVPTPDGAYCLNHGAPEVVRAMDELVALMVAQTEEARPAAPTANREGNVIARGWFYLMRGIPEHEFVSLYSNFMRAPLKAAPLGELFDVWRD